MLTIQTDVNLVAADVFDARRTEVEDDGEQLCFVGLKHRRPRHLKAAPRLKQEPAVLIGDPYEELVGTIKLVSVELDDEGNAGVEGCWELVAPKASNSPTENVQQTLAD